MLQAVVIALALTGIVTETPAQVRPAAGADTDARAARLRQLRAHLNDTDPDKRIAAAEEALGSGDRVLLRIVYEVGLASPDARLRSLILHHHLSNINNLVVGTRTPRPAARDVSERDGTSRQVIDQVANSARWSNIAVERGTSNVVMRIGPWLWNGRVEALGFTVSAHQCDIRMRLADAQTLRGELICLNTPVLQLESELQ